MLERDTKGKVTWTWDQGLFCPAAFVVPKAGRTIDPEELIAWCRERMANFKVPRQVAFTDALPRNLSGKVLKTELRGDT